jgi:hypothetical protein
MRSELVGLFRTGRESGRGGTNTDCLQATRALRLTFHKTMQKLPCLLMTFLLLAGVFPCSLSFAEQPDQPMIPKCNHIVVVVEENRAFSRIIGNLADAPFINTTLVPKAAVMTNFHAEAHPHSRTISLSMPVRPSRSQTTETTMNPIPRCTQFSAAPFRA